MLHRQRRLGVRGGCNDNFAKTRKRVQRLNDHAGFEMRHGADRRLDDFTGQGGLRAMAPMTAAAI